MARSNVSRLICYGRIDPIEYYVSHRYRVVYLENAKVACTAIKQLLYPDTSHAALGQEAFHAAIREQAALKVPGNACDYLHFSIFREPIARLRSCFSDKIQHAAAASAPSIFHNRFHRTVFRLLGGVDVTAADLAFSDFAQAVCKLPDPVRDRHIAAQAPLHAAVVAGQNHFVGKQEHLVQDWAALQAITGLPDLPRLNASRDHPRAEISVDPRTAQLIHQAYRADYAALGYEKSVPT